MYAAQVGRLHSIVRSRVDRALEVKDTTDESLGTSRSETSNVLLTIYWTETTYSSATDR